MRRRDARSESRAGRSRRRSESRRRADRSAAAWRDGQSTRRARACCRSADRASVSDARADRPTMELAIGQPRAMRQEIAERDRACGLVCLIERSLRIAQHAHARELGRTSRDRLVEVKASFVEHRQRRDGGHGLGHRRDAEDGVALDGQPGSQVALSRPPRRRSPGHRARSSAAARRVRRVPT